MCKHMLEAVSWRGTSLNLEALGYSDAPLLNNWYANVAFGLGCYLVIFPHCSEAWDRHCCSAGLMDFPLKWAGRLSHAFVATAMDSQPWISVFCIVCLSCPCLTHMPSFHPICLFNWKNPEIVISSQPWSSLAVFLREIYDLHLCLTFCWENIWFPKPTLLCITADIWTYWNSGNQPPVLLYWSPSFIWNDDFFLYTDARWAAVFHNTQ